jgi:hypothetical protein
LRSNEFEGDRHSMLFFESYAKKNQKALLNANYGVLPQYRRKKAAVCPEKQSNSDLHVSSSVIWHFFQYLLLMLTLREF